MNMKIWEELALIREAFEKQPLQRLKVEEDRGGYIDNEEENEEYKGNLKDGFYGMYCKSRK
ncbi:MAG: hypothetical protein NC320_01710 [Clostridium sp.]|nr:hypothetical protein [Clostridium sp.]